MSNKITIAVRLNKYLMNELKLAKVNHKMSKGEFIENAFTNFIDNFQEDRTYKLRNETRYTTTARVSEETHMALSMLSINLETTIADIVEIIIVEELIRMGKEIKKEEE